MSPMLPQRRAIDLERSECLGVSVFTGFPHADIYDVIQRRGDD